MIPTVQAAFQEPFRLLIEVGKIAATICAFFVSCGEEHMIAGRVYSYVLTRPVGRSQIEVFGWPRAVSRQLPAMSQRYFSF